MTTHQFPVSFEAQVGPILAIFDLDRTVIRGDSFREMIRHTYPRLDLLRSPIVVSAGMCRRLRLVSLKQFKEYTLMHFRSWSRDDIQRWGERFYVEKIAGLVSQQAKDVIRQHKAQRHELVLATGSPDVYVAAVAAELQFDKVLCTRLEYSGGRFTGRIYGDDCVGHAKLTQVARYSETRGADLSRAFFYTDHHSDVQLLNLVGHPCIVNPTSQLRRYSVAHNWPVLSWTTD